MKNINFVIISALLILSFAEVAQSYSGILPARLGGTGSTSLSGAGIATLGANNVFTGTNSFGDVTTFGSDVNLSSGGNLFVTGTSTLSDHMDLDTTGALALRVGFLTGNSNDTTGTYIELDRSQNTGPSLIIDAQGTSPGTNYFTDSAAGSVRIKGMDGDGLYLGGNSSASALKLDSSRNTTLGGDAIIKTVGKGLQVKTGSNAKLGSSVLSGGSVIVSNTNITANSYIFLTDATPGGTVGQLSYSKNNGVGFTITSSNILDTSTINWFIVEAAP